MESAAIIGLGLIGGSLARDLAGQGVRVSGHDADPASLRAALEQGVVTAALSDALDGMEHVDAVVLAVPVTEAIELLHSRADRLAHAEIVTDVCSTKASIMEAARQVGLGDRFIGGHPLAGDHRAGWNAARPGLFQGASVYVCAGEASAERLERVNALWRSVGAVPELLEPDEHDRLLASTSHLPQSVSTALARAIIASGIPLDRLGPGGRDMTRLARSTAEVWVPIALDNAAHLDSALAKMESELRELRAALARGDRSALQRFFAVDAPGPDQVSVPMAP